MDELNNMQDVIDSRDVIERIADLQQEYDDHAERVALYRDAEDEQSACIAEIELDAWVEENGAELEALESLAEEASSYAEDWEFGETLIRDDYFTEYAMEMLQGCGGLPENIPHYIVIDEEATARNVQMDYTAVDFDGVTYWIR